MKLFLARLLVFVFLSLPVFGTAQAVFAEGQLLMTAPVSNAELVTGGMASVSWTDTAPGAQRYTVGVYDPSGRSYTVAKNINGTQFNWSVGRAISDYGESFFLAPDYGYYFFVTREDGSNDSVPGRVFTILRRPEIGNGPILDVSIDSASVINPSARPGDKNVEFAVIDLTAIDGAVDISQLTIGTDSVSGNTNISNIRVIDGTTQIGSLASLQNPQPGQQPGYYGSFSTNLHIINGERKVLHILADVSSSASGKFRLGLTGLAYPANNPVADTTGPRYAYGYEADIFRPVSTVPQLTSISPNPVEAGKTITLIGNNFLHSNDINFTSTSVYGSGTLPGVVSNDGTTLQVTTPSYLPAGNYSVAVANTNGLSSYVPLAVTASSLPVGSSPLGSEHAAGTNVLGPDGTVYFISLSSRSPYTSEGAFLSYKFNSWKDVVTATSADMALPLTTYTTKETHQPATFFIPPRNGSLINDHGTVYLITGGLRAGFSSEAVFKGLGYSYKNVYAGDTSFMVTLAPINSSQIAHPYGTLINDKGTLYVTSANGRLGFPSLAVFDSWGYWASEAVPANSFDRQSNFGGVITTRMATQLSL